jgi:hypothetical protein
MVGRLMLLIAAGATNTAAAYPDGAPWGAADPDAAENCATCHFGSGPVLDSDAIEVDGWPHELVAGEIYELVLSFASQDAAIAGMQVLAREGDEEAGTFVAVPDTMECSGARARTTVPQPAENGTVAWRLDWQAPAEVDARVSLCIAITAANDDASAFGDTVHFRCVTVLPGTPR